MAISIKLVVDDINNKVLFAECDSNFVDILFSYLTLPLGTIVRLLHQDSGLPLLDNLYQSIQRLDTQYFQTESCKRMLLQPISNAERHCKHLAIRTNGFEAGRLFQCPSWDCSSKKHPYYSRVVGFKCPCGKNMCKANLCLDKEKRDSCDGAFLKRSVKFTVSDDLHVQVVSSVGPAVSFFQNIGITDISMLEVTEMEVDEYQLLQLLRRSLHSKTPLTDVFLEKSRNVHAVATETVARNVKMKRENIPMNENIYDADNLSVIKVKILQSKSSEKILVVQSENEFADLVFSFLTFPLGSALSLLGNRYSSSTLGCIHHVYDCIADLKDDKLQEILLAASKDLLLNPKLAPYFGCSNPILKVNELQSTVQPLLSCRTCFDDERDDCLHGLPQVEITELNPKIAGASSEYGGGFARSSSIFLINSNMKVKTMSNVALIQLLKDLGVASPDDLRETEVLIGEGEALNLLLACLTSTDIRPLNLWNLQ